MRRFATSVFKRDRQDNSSATPSSPSSLSLPKIIKRSNTLNVSPPAPLSIDYSLPSTPQLSAGSGPSQSSGCSSNGSADLCLQTPDDPPTKFVRTPTKSKHWISWLSKKSGTIKGKPPEQPDIRPRLGPEWHPEPPVLRKPPLGDRASQPVDDTEDETSSDSDDDDSSTSHRVPPVPSVNLTVALASPTQARQTLVILIQNSLRHRISLSPFVQTPTAPLYPRSCNAPRSLPCQETMHSTMLKTRLLRRLQRHSDMSASNIETASILPFSSRAPPIPIPSQPIAMGDEQAPPKAYQISMHSAGIRSWISRPCFEDRYAVWLPVDGVVTRQSVAGTSFGVAALEYSEALEAMVDFSAQSLSTEVPNEEPWTPVESDSLPSDTSPSPSSSNVSLTQVRHPSYSSVPSPLRNEHNPTVPPVISLTEEKAAELPPSAETSSQAAPPPAVVRRGVRFAEDDKEDVIPIGYVLRKKKHREEKERFLREEKERRLLEEERAKLAEERRKRELERQEWENERRAWEMEKRAAEEERRQRLYADEVAAARMRRETQRMGHNVTTKGTLTASPSSTSLRDPERNKYDSRRHSRPTYDNAPRRQASEPAVPTTSSSHSPHSSSPGSSRPPSIHSNSHSPLQSSSSIPSPPQANSRTPSVHSKSSSEEARQKKEKRHSVASLPSSKPHKDRTSSFPSSYPKWTSSNSNLLLPPMPPVPVYPLDMPLLPPTAPFMLQSYPRLQSRKSDSSSRGSPSSSPSRHHIPSNHSSERVNQLANQHRQGSSSPQRSDVRSISASPSASPHRHQRRGSGDQRRSSVPHVVPQSQERGRAAPEPSRSQPSSISRGRPPQPSAWQQPTVPSPWTALPSTSGRPISGMPKAAVGSHDSMRLHPSRRQTTIT